MLQTRKMSGKCTVRNLLVGNFGPVHFKVLKRKGSLEKSKGIKNGTGQRVQIDSFVYKKKLL